MTLPTTVADLKPAPYNPRRITKSAAEQLGKYMRELGDLSGIVYNKRTDRLVGAHQRVSQLPQNSKIHWIDEQTGVIRASGNEWRVRLVDWDEATEKRANVVANNPNLQGEFDQDKLAELLTEIDFESVGFTMMDVESAFSDEQIEQILGRPSILDEKQESDEVKDAVAGLEAMGGKRKEKQSAKVGPEGKPLPEDDFSDSIGSQARRKARHQQPDADYYRTVVFRSDKAAEEFMLAMGYPQNQRYIDGAFLLRLLKGEGNAEGMRTEGQGQGDQGQGQAEGAEEVEAPGEEE